MDTSKIKVGKHKIVITAGDDNFILSKTKSSIKIKKTSATVEYPKTVKKHSKINVTIINKANNKPVVKTKFTVKIYTGKNHKSITAKTNSEGILKINTNKLSKGKHKISVESKNKNYSINKKFYVKIK